MYTWFQQDTWFQRDRVTPHTTNLVIRCLKHKFCDQLILRYAAFLWPPGSPPNSMWFFLVAPSKGKHVFYTLSDLLILTSQIQVEIHKIQKKMSQDIYKNAPTHSRILPNVILK